ncbi:hypothetical protein AK812_SmicGene7690 [Symbiodinium microadriaticum]|uniref:Uncharacterized protein n=1 Tax=Symbiodinium microadriaticum TaxID=2951 RepID=A0A1Q9EMW3_SYMMI|nr:hypothetical protein AK812_SmicGene7690 [Symbiodinium microadriaticum]
MAHRVSVKEEDAEDEVMLLECDDESEALTVLGDATPVPPGVVLDKLSAMLSTGRARLRFASGRSWGVNGVVFNTWTSFRYDPDGSCRLVDGADWRTGTREDWAASELQQLADLREKAHCLPCTASAQPSVLRPRQCRRMVFQPTRHALAKLFGDWVSSRALQEEARRGESEGMKRAGGEMTIAAFLALVKERLRGAGEMPTYVKLLTSMKNNAGKGEIAKLLAGHPDLVSKIPAPKAGAKPQEKPRATPVTSPAATPATAAAATAATTATAAAREKKVQPQAPSISKTDAGTVRAREAVDVESAVLAPLRPLAPAAGLVRLAIRRGRPSQRLRLLRYLQSGARAKGAGARLREVFLVQRSEAAEFGQVVEAMRARLPELRGDSFAQRLAHICAVTDYFTTFELDEQETHDPADAQRANILDARAWNEGRLQLAMEAGVQPLFVDDPGVPLEQSGYAKRAKALGYRINFESMH